MIDTHCHLTNKHYRTRVPEVLAEARADGVRGLITVATTSEDSRAALDLAEAHDAVWCTAGVHPLYADRPRDWDAVRAVAEHDRCVAWGELGLDNHYEEPPRDQQDACLSEHLAMIESAAGDGLAMPIVVHCREAFDELLAAFRDAPFDPARYVFHCFTGGPDEARRVLDFGAWISFTGVVTFKNAKATAEAAKLVPLDRMMVETDAPYLTPEPMRKVWPNEPRFVVHTARFLANLRGIGEKDFERQMDENAERFFGIELPE